MANVNIREFVFTNSGGANAQQMLVEGSPTGREQLSIYGTLGGATIAVQKQLVLRDGTTSAITEIQQFNDEIDLEMATGKNNNLYVQITGMTASTNLIAKVSVLN